MPLLLSILLLSSCCCFGSTWYASSIGSSTNGTYTLPWSPQYAVTNTNPHLQPGDTVYFKKNETYSCVESNVSTGYATSLQFRKSGTVTSPITYSSETLWSFSFDGCLIFENTVSNLVIKNFRVFWSGSTNRNRTNIWTHPPAIETYAHNVYFLHNLLENCGTHPFGTWKTTAGKYIAGNIGRFSGCNDYTGGTWTGQARGGFMYSQNLDNSDEALIQGNISIYNYTTGYGMSGNSDIFNFRLLNNIMFDADQGGIFYQQDDYSSTGIKVISNYCWKGNPCVRLGYQSSLPSSNAIVVGNYLVDYTYPMYNVSGWTNCTWTNNTIVNLANRYVWFMERSGETNASIGSHTIDYNTYWSTNYGTVGNYPFQTNEVVINFDTWKAAVHGDTNSTITTGAPNSTVSYLFRPSTDTNFLHVVVFNWPTNASATVNLSSYFQKGDVLSLYDAQNIPTPFENVSYTGGDIDLPLTLTNRAQMLGSFVGRGTWSGFDDRFRAFVIYKKGRGTIHSNNSHVRNMNLSN